MVAEILGLSKIEIKGKFSFRPIIVGHLHLTKLKMDKNNNSKITAKPAETPYGIRSFPDESTLNGNLKKQLGPEFLSERAGPGGMKVPYIEGTDNAI